MWSAGASVSFPCPCRDLAARSRTGLHRWQRHLKQVPRDGVSLGWTHADTGTERGSGIIQQPDGAVRVCLKNPWGSRAWGRRMYLGKRVTPARAGHWAVLDGPSCPRAQWGDAKSLRGACPKRGSSPFPIMLTLQSSSVTPSAEDGVMEAELVVTSTQGQSFPGQQRPHGHVHKPGCWRSCSVCAVLLLTLCPPP